MLDMIEGICSEQGSQELGWLRCGQDMHIHRQRLERERKLARDRRHERQQEVLHKLRTVEIELDSLRRENELLRQENEVLKSRGFSPSLPEAVAQTTARSLRYASFMLPRFSGIDPTEYASNWIKALNKCASVFGWTDADTLLAARMSLDGIARQWLVAQRRDLTTWKDFQKAFISKYRKAETAVANIYLALAKRKKKDDEDLEEYLSEVEMLGASVSLEERQIVEFMVNGLPDDMCAIKNELKKSKTIQELRSNLRIRRAACIKDRKNLFRLNHFINVNMQKYVEITLLDNVLIVFLFVLFLLAINLVCVYIMIC